MSERKLLIDLPVDGASVEVIVKTPRKMDPQVVINSLSRLTSGTNLGSHLLTLPSRSIIRPIMSGHYIPSLSDEVVGFEAADKKIKKRAKRTTLEAW